MSVYVSPSMLAADFTKLGEQIKIMEQTGVTHLHLDVMDGVFVPNISFGIPVIQGIRKASNMIFDVHLMIIEPERYISTFHNAGADIINFHIEATKDVSGCIAKIKECGAKVGITIKPNTPVTAVEPYLQEIDMVLVMTVEPGFGGQSFMPEQMAKVEQLSAWKKERNLQYDIEVDGGVTLENLRTVLDAGANIIVAGSAILGKSDIAQAATSFLNICKEYE